MCLTSWSTLSFVRGLLVLCLVSGCGFHLRSYNLESNVESFAITGKVRARVVSMLRQNLRQLGVAEKSAGEAAVVIEILDQRNQRRSVSTAGRARTAEYEVDYGLHYQILDAAGLILAPPTWIERQRIYRVDRDNIVGSSEEQSILQRELMQDIAGQIIRAMDLVSRVNLRADE